MKTKMDDNSIMPFGKHKGEKLANVPPGYLLYLYDAGYLRGELKKYAEDNIAVLKFQKEQEEKRNRKG
jgi:uncharacterized protein (DUF3820 family)